MPSPPPPPFDNIRIFGGNIWQDNKYVNLENDWYRVLKETYCTHAVSKEYEISDELFQSYLSKMPNNKSLGPDLLSPFWVKNLTSVHDPLLTLMQKSFKKEIHIPTWLIMSKTILIPKNTNTHLEKNYRPIACLNITYKIYTSMLNHFLVDHCTSNDIITVEQAGGKKGSWGCADQLLINKMVLDEIRKHKRNLFMMWFD